MIKNIGIISFVVLFLNLCSYSFSQEALKSTEEEYYDFLSLQGIVNRPTLNYRTLSDSEWEINTESLEIQNDDGTVSEKTVDLSHPWQNNNLGKKFTLFEVQNKKDNWFLRGIKQSIKAKIYGPEWFNSYNTAAPYGQNDGALWQGKGYNTSLTTGARLEGYGFELTVKPQLCFSQNAEFEIMSGTYTDSNNIVHRYYDSEYAYFWGYGNNAGVDLPQRFGDKSFWTFDFGDTELRYTWHTLTVGFGTQAIWLGPAWLNPMLGSNNAGTYPKLDIGLRKTQIHLPWLGWYLGDIEGRVWVGYLSESDYFDNDDSNNHNQLTGFSVSYAPSFIKGLTLGINKICLNKWNEKSIKYLNPFYNSNNLEDQKASFSIDWIFPQVGFEIYGELGIDDYSAHKTANPFHTAIYTVGAKKTFNIIEKKGLFAELMFEWNNFEMSQDFQLQWKYMGYYSHGLISQGYTQKGQILGAGSGYFGNSQYLGLKLYYPKGYTNIFFHFNRPDTNYINNLGVNHSNADWTLEHEKWAIYKTYKTIGISSLFYVEPNTTIQAEFDCTFLNYPDYDKNDVGFMTYRICLSAKYQL